MRKLKPDSLELDFLNATSVEIQVHNVFLLVCHIWKQFCCRNPECGARRLHNLQLKIDFDLLGDPDCWEQPLLEIIVSDFGPRKRMRP